PPLFYYIVLYPLLHPFPTRRSSDLACCRSCASDDLSRFRRSRPYIVDRRIFRIERNILTLGKCLAHSLVSGITGCIDRSRKKHLISCMECFSKFLCEW